MKTDIKNDVCSQSRRQLLKKLYVAPVVVAMGTMILSSPAEAMSRGGGSGGYRKSNDSHDSGYKSENKHEYKKTENTRGGSSSLHQDNGWGNGDDKAPGGSYPHNNAENDTGGKAHRKFGDSNAD